MRTPDASTASVRSSPRSLKNNHSKRKLDLTVLIDQMPDKDFIEIGSTKSSKPDNAHLLNVISQLDKSAERKKHQFKQPLTEHQKEVRRSQKKSFIPMEIQSVCCVLEPTMDSQMSMMDDDTNTQSLMGMPQYSFNAGGSNTVKKSLNMLNTESSKAISQFKKVRLCIQQHGLKNL
jgi:hypothetical protein